MPYTIPIDTHAVGDSNHTPDHNNIVDVLKGLQAPYVVLNTAYAGGADPTGAADSSPAFAAAIAALPASGGNIIVPPGSYKLNSGLTFHQAQGMIGAGSTAVSITYTGAGTAININISGTFTGGEYGGRFEGFFLTGYTAGAAAVGVQFGNLQGVYTRDVAVYGFGGKGIYGLNSAGNWSEQNNIQARIVQCGTAGSATSAAMVLDTSSFDYSDLDLTIVTSPGTGGLYLQNGAQLQGAHLRMRGNFYGSAGNTAAVIALEKAGGAGTAYIRNTALDVAVESAGANTGHFTVYLGSTNAASQLFGTGVLSFSNVAVAFQGISNAHFLPIGVLATLGDQVLGAIVDFGWEFCVSTDGTNSSTGAIILRPYQNNGALLVNGTPLETKVASTGPAGFAMINGTATILSWTAPSDGLLHRVKILMVGHVTSGMTGGQIQISRVVPDGFANTVTVANGGTGAGGILNAGPGAYDDSASFLIGAGTTISLKQTSALTAGAVTLFAEIWAS